MAKVRPEDIEIAKRTSRAGGAVGGKALVPQVAAEFMLPHHKVLDFGAGKDAMHAKKYRGMGFDVTAYDYHDKPNIHDPTALDRRYDVVYASNVVNVQNSPHALASTLNQIAKATKPTGGVAILNLPIDPRKGVYDKWPRDQHAAKVETALKRRFKQVSRHPRGSNMEPIWICREPIHPGR